MSTIPQGPVEARSLSSVTTIASNPPAYPRNPTHEKHEPLSLYIVRVPGSKDIFLSPLKPPTKSSVSAEAINASLYYLHVATPDDDTLLQEVEEEREEEAQLRKERLAKAGVDDPAQREFARLNNVRRKPDATAPPALPLRPTPALQDEIASPALPPRPIPMPQDDAAQDATAPPALPPRPVPMPQVTAENVSFSGTPVANMQPPLTNNTSGGVSVESGGKSGVSRRPLPPLPPGEESWTNSAAGEDPSKRTSRWSAFTEQLQNRGENWRGKYEAKYEAFAAGRHSLDSNGPQLRPRSSHNRTGSPLGSPGQSPNRHRNEHDDPRSNAGFHITLIRRDPTSGTQWNVATISTPRMDRNAVDIEISTPGYNRFAGSNEMPSLSSLAANLPTGIGRLPNSAIVQSLAAEQPKEQPTGPRKFHRQLCVSKPFDDSVATDSSNGHNPDGPSSSKLKSGYYVFTSPWNGTCTFTNSVNGRSLKCKHMIPTPGGFIPPNGEAEAPPAVTVAELRFNTPFQAANLHSHAHHAIHKPHPNHLSPFTQSQIQTPSLSRPNDNPNDNNPSPEGGPLHPSSSNNSFAAAKRNSLSQFLNPNAYARPRAHTGPGSTPPHPASPPADSRSQPHSHRSTSNSSGGDLDYDSDEDRLDLSLARENAGGGLRGKSAKLGKLVIEDEGIKMLDLVVAACMAVWWRGYYY
ncbi:Pc22g03900 [Penicillium rubens Wisconsin 54-1255]|uniref:Pc22g03900 protein n=1 Tax=Penicillium rubens (strain ATCC 28089 / DSM 1075 / NRRL 1951 / Wisconsin 54-1255) TaxID=500485 RepID=B6HS75_PENRW|nr:Pc22g03900 [Penicillium rubens Wisconsin 54-1255]